MTHLVTFATGEPGGRERTVKFDSRADAERFKALVAAVGPLRAMEIWSAPDAGVRAVSLEKIRNVSSGKDSAPTEVAQAPPVSLNKPYAARPPEPARMAPPTYPTQPAYQWQAPPPSSRRGVAPLWAAAAVLAIVVVSGVLIASMMGGEDRSTLEAGRSTSDTEYVPDPSSGSPNPDSSDSSPRGRSGSVDDSVVKPVVQNTIGVVVGTCDEGGSCGVKQRNAPLTAAPRLVSSDLQDAMSVTLVCQTSGDVRSSAGYGSSSTWYRLQNGAYVNSVYLDVSGPALPAC